MTRPPSHIPLPPPPSFSTSSAFSSDLSPDLFYSAPSSPFSDPDLFYTPPLSPFADPPPPPPAPILIPHRLPSPTSAFDDSFPSDITAASATTIDVALDLALNDNNLTALERIFLYSCSKFPYHRIFIAHTLPLYLQDVDPRDAIEYVLPLLSGLAMDPNEQVKEAFAAELVRIIWYYFTHCKVIPDHLRTTDALYLPSSDTVTISVQAFTAIFGTLLLSPNPLVGGTTRFALVSLLTRMKKADEREGAAPSAANPLSEKRFERIKISVAAEEDVQDDDDFVTGLFSQHEREMFRNELLHQVVIGMGRLDVEMDVTPVKPDSKNSACQGWPSNQLDTAHLVTPDEEQETSSPIDSEKSEAVAKSTSNINPYFPLMSPSPSYSLPSPASSTASTPSSGTTGTSSSHSSGELSPAVSTNPKISPVRELAPFLNAAAAATTTQPPLVASNLTCSDVEMSSPEDYNRQSSESSRYPGTSDTWMPQSQGYVEYQKDQDYPSNAYGIEDDGDEEQAAIGRLSSMSLMAAVTATGFLGEGAQRAFVKEVERVGRDPVYWVRREAVFALGALAKVVPQEVVVCSLLPLLSELCSDPAWHVRHSILFALPAVLDRLSPLHRRNLALKTIIGLSQDESPNVRTGVLESLGEVLYTFHGDADGPPEELVQLFFGRKEDRRVRDGQQYSRKSNYFSDDTERPLICAFNFPAVALTLGGGKWADMRDTYLDLATNRESRVRRTLAASLGEMARIIGKENAQQDLVGVWWDAIRCDEEEVRTKALGCLDIFLGVLGTEVGQTLLQGLLTVWDERVFRGWRERNLIVQSLPQLSGSVGQDIPLVVRSLLLHALEDQVAGVRETAVSTVPLIWSSYSSRFDVLSGLRDDLQTLAKSPAYRKRMTFIACWQSLLAADQHGSFPTPINADDLKSIVTLASDAIEGVRICVARFLSIISGKLLRDSRPLPSALLEFVNSLAVGPGHEALTNEQALSHSTSTSHGNSQVGPNQASGSSEVQGSSTAKVPTFSRPPPLGSPPSTEQITELLEYFMTMSRRQDHSKTMGGTLRGSDLEEHQLVRQMNLHQRSEDSSLMDTGSDQTNSSTAGSSVMASTGLNAAEARSNQGVLRSAGDKKEGFEPEFGVSGPEGSIIVPG